jgi:hypothetical protein
MSTREVIFVVRVLSLCAAVVAAGACSSTTNNADGAAAGAGGTHSGAAGAGGAVGGAGGGTGGAAAGRGGSSGAAGTAGGGGASGSQPLGAVCVNNGNCSQADGTAVCCLQISTCVLDIQCPGGTNYVSCETQPCTKAGWVCCSAGGMHFCTKQSGCPAP